MKLEDFKLIENEFEIVLPEDYKEIVLSNPFMGKEYRKIKDSLFIDVKTIIEANKNVQLNNYLDKKWPKNLFIIGSGRINAYSVIDLKNDKGIVYAVIPEDQKPDKNIIKKKQANSLIKFIETEKLFAKM